MRTRQAAAVGKVVALVDQAHGSGSGGKPVCPCGGGGFLHRLVGQQRSKQGFQPTVSGSAVLALKSWYEERRQLDFQCERSPLFKDSPHTDRRIHCLLQAGLARPIAQRSARAGLLVHGGGPAWGAKHGRGGRSRAGCVDVNTLHNGALHRAWTVFGARRCLVCSVGALLARLRCTLAWHGAVAMEVTHMPCLAGCAHHLSGRLAPVCFPG